ncbi:MAG: CPn0927/CPn0928 family alpha/beta hydrolase fold protein [Candidatus Rhabdochlamydia sp.]
MTISRASSSDNLYLQPPALVQTAAEKLAENIVHTWHLAEGDKAYLICDNGKLDCLFVRGDDGIMVPIPIPNSDTLEEIINRLLEMYPILKGDNTIGFMKYEEEPISDANCQRPANSIRTETSFRNILSGEKAFYNQPDYLKAGKQDWSSNKYLPISYTWNTEHKIIRIAKEILPTLIFLTGVYNFFYILAGKASLKQPLPALILSIGIYKLLQIITGILILPATGLMQKDLNETRSEISLRGQWKYKRITIEVDNYKIDSVIVGKPSTLDNGRWLLASNGNCESYEQKLLTNDEFKQILHKCNSNALVFNYPGVGSSSGPIGKKAMVKAYRAMLTFLEDKEKGIEAKGIIGYGLSIGGGIQGEALKMHPLKKDIKYVFIKDRTFSTLSQLVSLMMGRFLGFAVKCLGWEMDSVTSSKKLQAPEIILQTTKRASFHQLKSIDDLRESDDIIEKEGSLAFELLKGGTHENKHYLGITSKHNDALGREVIEHLSEIVNQALAEDSKIKTS